MRNAVVGGGEAANASSSHVGLCHAVSSTVLSPNSATIFKFPPSAAT